MVRSDPTELGAQLAQAPERHEGRDDGGDGRDHVGPGIGDGRGHGGGQCSMGLLCQDEGSASGAIFADEMHDETPLKDAGLRPTAPRARQEAGIT